MKLKLADILTTAAAGLVATSLSAQEAKADILGDLLQRGAQEYLDNQARNGNDGGLILNQLLNQGGRNASCHRDFFLSNGNRGGTFDPCNGEYPPPGTSTERPKQRGPKQDCYATDKHGRSLTGRSSDCGSDPNSWSNLRYR